MQGVSFWLVGYENFKQIVLAHILGIHVEHDFDRFVFIKVFLHDVNLGVLFAIQAECDMGRFRGVVKDFQFDKVIASHSHIKNMRRNVELDREPHTFTLISNDQATYIRIQDASALDFYRPELCLRKTALVFNLRMFLDLLWGPESLHINLDQIIEIVAKIVLFAILGGRKAAKNTFKRIARLTEDEIDRLDLEWVTCFMRKFKRGQVRLDSLIGF